MRSPSKARSTIARRMVKAMFNHHAFRDRVRLSGVNSINWARIVAQVGLLFHRGGRARRAASQGRLHRADRKFRRCLCGLCRRAHGSADRSAGDRDQRQRHSRAHASRPAPTRCATWSRPPRPRWTSRYRRISSGCCSRPMAATPAQVARADGFARAIAALLGAGARAQGRCARCSPPIAPMSRKPPRPSAPGCARPAIHRSAYRGRAGGRRKGNARSGSADGGAVDRASGQVPRCGRGRLRRAARRCRIGLPICRQRQGARHRAAGRSGGGRTFRGVGVARRA